jgi:putative hemolysin
MKNTIIFFSIIILLIIGLVSCQSKKGDNTTSNNQAGQVTSQRLTVTKKPITQDIKNDSYDFCEDRGYEVIIRFDEESENSKIYCRFNDTTECEADAFVRGTCNPGNGATLYRTEDNPRDVVICSQNYDPVCGINEITYSNECTASINNIKIKSKGVCIDIQEEIDEQPTATINNRTVITKDKPDWLNLVIDLITVESAKTPKSYIDKCIYSGNTVYYQFTGGDNFYTTLYDQDGQAICYPSNQLGSECPDYFNSKNRSRSCKRLWTDER